MLGKMETETIALNAYTDVKRAPRRKEDRDALLKNLSEIMLTLKADVGVFLEADGERMTLVDETGHVLAGTELLATMVSLVAKTHPGVQIALPVTAPSVIAKMVTESGGGVLWTKTDTRSLMAAAAESKAGGAFAGDDAGGFIFTELHPTFDALFAFAKSLEMLATQGAKLSDVRRALPPLHIARAEVRCPWEAKGRVMRVLTEQINGQRVEMLDGIKFYNDDNNWALVLPDASEPVVHIFAEGSSQDAAAELAHRYALKVTALRG